MPLRSADPEARPRSSTMPCYLATYAPPRYSAYSFGGSLSGSRNHDRERVLADLPVIKTGSVRPGQSCKRQLGQRREPSETIQRFRVIGASTSAVLGASLISCPEFRKRGSGRSLGRVIHHARDW